MRTEKHGDHRGACHRPGGGNGNANTFDRLDRNNNGLVSRAEWPYGDDAFRRLDRSDDGNLRPRESRRYFRPSCFRTAAVIRCRTDQ